MRMSQLKIYLLGSPLVESENATIQMDTRKAFALLAYLAVTAEQHSRDTLATLLWPDYDQKRARAAFRRTLSTLKKAVGDEHLEINRESIALQIDDSVWIDAHQFQKLIRECKDRTQSINKTCIKKLEEAVALYRGDFMAGFTLRDSASFDDWQFFQDDSFKRDLASALQDLLEGYSQSGDYEKATAYGRQWLAIDPLREEAHRALMKNYEWAGQHTAALRQYRECVRILEQELGVPPLEETTRVYELILEKQLPPPVISSLEVKFGASQHSPEAQPPAQHALVYPLVGRKDEWNTLLSEYGTASLDGKLCFIEGEVGIGKTRLADEFLQYARQQGAQVFEAHCYEGEANLAYGPIMAGFNNLLSLNENANRLQDIPGHWLSEAGRLVPEIHTLIPETPPATPMDDPGAQARFFEGLRQVLTHLLKNGPPGVFFLDDLQWADSASLDWLFYLSRRLKGTGLFILVTIRDDILLADHPLHQLFAEATRVGIANHIQLKRLGQSEVAKLVNSTAGLSQDLPVEFVDRLYQESEGLPLIAVEYLAGFTRRADKQRELTWATPGSVQEVLSTRLAGISDTGDQLLTTAAVIGRSFDFKTLREVSGRSERETVSGLEGLLEHGLILEHTEGEHEAEVIYDFTHEKLRQVVYQKASLTRRRLLHLRVAEVLSNQIRSQGNLASIIANHYLSARKGAMAAEYFQRAGDHARALYANQEAINFYQAALANGYPDSSQLYESIGDLQIYQGEYRASISSYETAAALCRPGCLPRLEHKLGNAHHRRGDWEMAEQHYLLALDELGAENNLAQRSNIFADLSRNTYLRGDPKQALELANDALELAEGSSDLSAMAKAHNTLGILARSIDDYEQAIHQLTQSLEIADELKDLDSRIAALNNLALVYRDAGEIEQAIAYNQTALDLCRQQGDRHREAALLNNHADLLHASGRADEAMEYLRQAVVIFAEIGVEEGSLKPEIWKLVEW
jgi:predicted ATPase/DNA-binding SARP family transcriptional activator